MDIQKLSDPKKIMEKWVKRSNLIQNLHYDSAATMMRWHRWTGSVLVVLSLIEGSTLLKTLTSATKPALYGTIAIGVIGLVVAILAAMQAFLSFEARSRLHYIAGVKYGAIKRKLEVRFTADPDCKDAATFLEELAPEWDALTEESEPIPLRIWKRGEKKEEENKNRKKGVNMGLWLKIFGRKTPP